MPESLARMKKRLGPIASLLMGVALLIAGNGLQLVLLPLRGGSEASAPSRSG